MNKESCSSLVFIKFADGESFGVWVLRGGGVKSWGDCVKLAARRMGVIQKKEKRTKKI